MPETTNQIGNRLEGIAVRILERDGYRTYRVRRTPIRRSDGSWFHPGNLDIGASDILAWKVGEKIRAVQVTASTSVQDRIDAFAEAGWPNEHCRQEIWYDQSIAAGLGVTREEHRWQAHFRVRWSDDAFALVKDRLVFFDAERPAEPQRQKSLGRMKF